MNNLSYLDESQLEILQILERKSHLQNESELRKLKQLLLAKLVHLENMTIKQKGNNVVEGGAGEENLDLFTKNLSFEIFEKGDFIYQQNQYCKDVYIILFGEVGIWEKKSDAEITKELDQQKKIFKLENQLQESHSNLEQKQYIQKIEEANQRLEKYRQRSKEKLLKMAFTQQKVKYFITVNTCGYYSNFSMKAGSLIGDNQAISGEKFEKSYQIFSEKCVCLKISGFKFNEIFDLQVKKINYIEGILSSNFPHANPQSLLWLAYQSQDRYLKYDEKVFMEEDPGDSIYIIRQGIIELSKLLTIKNSSYNQQNIRKNVNYEKRLELATLQEDSLFGIESMNLGEKDGARFYRARATFNPISLVYQISKEKINKIILENCDEALENDIIRMQKMKQKFMKERFLHLVEFNTGQMNEIFQRRKVIQAQMAYKKNKLVDTVLSQLFDTHSQQEKEKEQEQELGSTKQNTSFESKQSENSGKLKSLQSLNNSFESDLHQQKLENIKFKRKDRHFKTLKTFENETNNPKISNENKIKNKTLKRGQSSAAVVSLKTNLVSNFTKLDQENRVQMNQKEDSDVQKIKILEKIKNKMNIYRKKVSSNKESKNSQNNSEQIGFPCIMEDQEDSQGTPVTKRNSQHPLNIDISGIGGGYTQSKFANNNSPSSSKFQGIESPINSPFQKNQGNNSKFAPSSNNSSFNKTQSQNLNQIQEQQGHQNRRKDFFSQINFSSFCDKVNNLQSDQDLEVSQNLKQEEKNKNNYNNYNNSNNNYNNSNNSNYMKGVSFEKLQIKKTISVNQSQSQLNTLNSDDEKRIFQEENSLFYNQNTVNTNNTPKKKYREQAMTQQQQFQDIVTAREQVKEKYFNQTINTNKDSEFWIPNSKQKEIQKKYSNIANIQKQPEKKKSKHFQPSNFKGNTEKLLDHYIQKEQIQNSRNNLFYTPQQSLKKTIQVQQAYSRSNLREKSKFQNTIKLDNIPKIANNNNNSNNSNNKNNNNRQQLQQDGEDIFIGSCDSEKKQVGSLSCIQRKHVIHQKLFMNNSKKLQMRSVQTSRKNSVSYLGNFPQLEQKNYSSQVFGGGTTCNSTRYYGRESIGGFNNKLFVLPKSMDKRYVNNNNNVNKQNRNLNIFQKDQKQTHFTVLKTSVI